MPPAGYVYIMTNRPRGTLYIGVTSDVARRIFAHRNGDGAAFVRRYGLHRLVHIEPFAEIESAIAREKQIKHWNRDWKLQLIEKSNPDWHDLFEHLSG